MLFVKRPKRKKKRWHQGPRNKGGKLKFCSTSQVRLIQLSLFNFPWSQILVCMCQINGSVLNVQTKSKTSINTLFNFYYHMTCMVRFHLYIGGIWHVLAKRFSWARCFSYQISLSLSLLLPALFLVNFPVLIWLPVSVDTENSPWIASYTTYCIEFISLVSFSCTVLPVKD